MTTIAYRDGIVAADSLAVSCGWKMTHAVQKLHRMKDGSVCAVSGDLTEGMAFIRAMDAGQEQLPALGDSARVVHFKRGRVISVYEGTSFFSLQCNFCAWGSGSPAANAALIMGADAVRAVEVAAMLDDSTGGEIVSMEVPE